MLRRKKGLLKISALLAVLILYLSINLSPVQISLSDPLVSVNRSISQSYAVHDPILISNDSELAAVANSGAGTVNDPYIIAGWNITSSSRYGISIKGTTKHFRIENCWIVNTGEWHIYRRNGISVDNIASGTTIINNNTCSNYDSGIYLRGSENSTISNNTCSNNSDGIDLSHSNFSNITNNICYNNDYGISVWDSDYSTISKNTFFNDGLFFWFPSSKEGIFSYTVENNTVNELPLGYFENLTDITITGAYGQLILINCNNSIVKNKNLSNTSIGIALYYSHENHLINNTCDNNNHDGIFLYNSSSSTVVNNTCNNNNGLGIYLGYSDFSTVANNTCNNNGYGMQLWISGSSNVVNNTCNNNFQGIDLSNNDFSIINNNTCNNNREYGMYLESSHSLIVTNNTCDNNNGLGIYLGYSDFSTVANNTCNNNREYGISLVNSHSLIVTNNTYNNNGIGDISLSDSSYIADTTTPNPTTNPTTNPTNPTNPTTSGTKISNNTALLYRIELFLFVIGLLLLIFFVSRRSKSV